jgi:hypothetical protein
VILVHTMDKKTEIIHLRVTLYEKNRMKHLAEMYAGGDLSLWMRWAGLNAERKMLMWVPKKTPARKPQRGKRRRI